MGLEFGPLAKKTKIQSILYTKGLYLGSLEARVRGHTKSPWFQTLHWIGFRAYGPSAAPSSSFSGFRD